MMKTINRSLITGLLLIVTSVALAQTSKKEIFGDIYRTGSNYFAYPGPKAKALTKAPEGYTPFYISHYGRHGSRYMSNNEYYVTAINKLDSAQQMGILTKLGEDVLAKLRIGYADAWHRDGDLSKLGAQQHHDIAHRMYERFPELLSQPLCIDAKASTSRRVMLSMFNFCQELQRLNPDLEILMDASKHDFSYVVEDLSIQPAATPQGRDLMEALYNVAEDLQNVPELNISLIEVFTKQELFDMWQGYNAGWLLNTGLVPGSTPYYLQQKEVLDSILSTADKVILAGKPTATLRFSHDSSVLPLTYLLGLKEAMGGVTDIKNLYKYISIDKIIPMAANIQIIFYRKADSDDILVKFLLNENETSVPALKTDVAPYYHWKDVRTYLTRQF